MSQGVIDVDWLQRAGANNWPALMKDEKIRYRPAERAAIIEHGVRGFYLTSGNLTSHQMAEAFIVNRDAIWAHAVEPGPGLFAVSRNSVRQIALHD